MHPKKAESRAPILRHAAGVVAAPVGKKPSPEARHLPDNRDSEVIRTQRNNVIRLVLNLVPLALGAASFSGGIGTALAKTSGESLGKQAFSVLGQVGQDVAQMNWGTGNLAVLNKAGKEIFDAAKKIKENQELAEEAVENRRRRLPADRRSDRAGRRMHPSRCEEAELYRIDRDGIPRDIKEKVTQIRTDAEKIGVPGRRVQKAVTRELRLHPVVSGPGTLKEQKRQREESERLSTIKQAEDDAERRRILRSDLAMLERAGRHLPVRTLRAR